MSNPKSILFILSMLMLISCQTDGVKPIEKTDYNESGLNCKITNPAGDMYEKFSQLELPPFFNIAQFQLSDDRFVNAIVLSKRAKKGSKVNVDPVALFSLKKNNEVLNYVVAIPHDNGDNNIVKEYDEFLIKNNEVKMAIENWFRAQCGYSYCKDLKWQNSYKALLEIE